MVRASSPSPGAFLFMLSKDIVSGSSTFKPAKWGTLQDRQHRAVCRWKGRGPIFGSGPDLRVGPGNLVVARRKS
ncbi:unnamed protein product [Pylaiella littoralis]